MNGDDIELTDTVQLRTLCQYAAKKKENLQGLLNECTNMSFWSRVRDSKFPEKDKAIYQLYIIKPSDKYAILKRIRDYHKFCDEISAIVIQIIEPKYIKSDDLYRKIDLLQEKLSQVYESAMREVDETSSKTIYNMHQCFIKEYEKLDGIVKDFEILALNDCLTAAEKNWTRSRDELTALMDECDNIDMLFMISSKIKEKHDLMLDNIVSLFERLALRCMFTAAEKSSAKANEKMAASTEKTEDKIDKYSHICDTYYAVVTENRKVVKKQNSLSIQNEQLEEKVDEIRRNDNCDDICYTFDADKNESHKIAEKQIAITAQNGQLEKNMDKMNMSDKHYDICDTYDTLKRENQECAEKQNSLSVQNEQLEVKVDEISGNDYCDDICYTFDAVKSESHKIEEKQIVITTQNGQLAKNKDKMNMSDKHYDICDTYDTLKRKNQEFAEKQDALKVQNGQSDQTMDTEINNKYTDISQKYESLKIRQDDLLARYERLDEKVDDIMRLLRSFNP